ncbi:MAG: endonuclease/exonuclease/phosphatase family protein [Verrucomicrobiota bacterium]|nr:endonuclease/exonuclease/phosphatase family protein [Verrucomicrobiota bacterium]
MKSYLPVTHLRFLLLVGVVFAEWSTGFAAAPVVIRVASFNVHNYCLIDRRVDGKFVRDYPKPEEEKRALRTLLKSVNADIVALQEMGALPFLEELQADLRAEGLDYPVAQVLAGSDESRHIAVLTRLKSATVNPITDLHFNYFGKSTAVKRGLIEVELKTSGTPWMLYIVHLKSRLTERDSDPDNRIRRTGEATAIRDFILSRTQGSSKEQQASAKAPPASTTSQVTPALLVGDFNDTLDSPAIKRLLRKGDRKLAELIPATDTRGETWTFYYKVQDVYSRIDFLVANPPMLTHVVGAGKVADNEYTQSASDHRLIYVDLKFEGDSLRVAQ